jgi:RNA polymerase sigma-70 factor, ECF subfamily
MDESEAISRLKQGDIGGLEALVRLHQTRALRVAFLITRDHAMAEDVVQSAFLRAYDRIAQFDAARPFAPWFMRCVANDALKSVQRRDRHQPLESELATQNIELTSPELGLDQILEAAEISVAVAAALDRLPPAQRTALVLRYYLNMSDAEMSERLDCATGTVRWRLSVARQRMRQLLPAWLDNKE